MKQKFILAFLWLAMATTFTHAQQKPLYLDTTYSDTERATDLIQRMTLDEKIAQLQNRMQLVQPGETGVGSFGFMSKDSDIAESVTAYNTYQRAQIENTRLGIPASRSGEGLFAYMGNGSTSFPSPLGIAASFDPGLQAEVAGVLAKELKSRGISRVLAPVVNLTRDPRWDRRDLRVTNTKNRNGDNVVPLYLHDTNITQPIQKLIGFERLKLEARTSKNMGHQHEARH